MTEQQKRTRLVNDIGLGLAGSSDERMVDFRLYEESGSIRVECEFRYDAREAFVLWAPAFTGGRGWIEQHTAYRSDGIDQVAQYMTPEEAMAFSKAFERCAIAALKNRA